LSENHLPVKYDTPTQREQIIFTGQKSYIHPRIYRTRIKLCYKSKNWDNSKHKNA